MENPVFDFELEYEGQLVHCEATMHETGFDVSIDGKPMGQIYHNEDATWSQRNGAALSNEIVQEIGSRIESQYE